MMQRQAKKADDHDTQWDATLVPFGILNLTSDQLSIYMGLDGGSATRSERTEFIKRMVELSKTIGISIRLVYYPPYHSKYNPIERCWAALENYWNGAILDSVETEIQWARNMTWKGIVPIVHLIDGIYEKKIKVLPEVLNQHQPFWQRSETLPKNVKTMLTWARSMTWKGLHPIVHLN
jgi:hypothetical protein